MNTLERLIQVFERVFEDEVDTAAIRPESTLMGDLGMNSIGMLYMAMALEEEFEIKFSNADFQDLVTVDDVVQRVESKK